jgi:MscS family membrane protein
MHFGEKMQNIVFFLVILTAPMLLAEDSILKQLGLNNKADESTPAVDVQNIACKTPRAALSTFFDGIKKESIQCFKQGSYSTRELLIFAERLLSVLRSHGIIINVDKVPNDPDYKDPRSQKSIYYLSLNLKSIYLEKKHGSWVFTKDVIESIDAMYKKTRKLNLGEFYDYIPAWATMDLFGVDGFTLVQIAILLLLILFSLAIRLIVAWLVSRQIAKIFLRIGMYQFEVLTKKASFPIGSLFMAGFLAIFIPGLDFNVHITHYLLISIRLGACIAAVLLLYRSVDMFAYFMMEQALKTDSKLDDQLVPLFRKGLKIITVLVGVIFVLQNLDVDVTSLLAGVTIGGLAFSFAARDTVANLFGSITIFADKPFLVGDWIKAADVEGIVEQVGFRSTRVRTFYNSLVSVPNSKFTDSVVDNLGARKYRRILAELGLAYGTEPDQMEIFCNGIRAIIKAHPQTRKDVYEIHFSGYGDFSLKIMLYFFAEVSSWSEELRCRHEIYLDILRLAKKINVKFAFPTQTLHIESMTIPSEPKPKIIPSEDDLKNAAAYFAPNGQGVIPPGPRLGKPYFAKD